MLLILMLSKVLFNANVVNPNWLGPIHDLLLVLGEGHGAINERVEEIVVAQGVTQNELAGLQQQVLNLNERQLGLQQQLADGLVALMNRLDAGNDAINMRLNAMQNDINALMHQN
jgi:hypothetical protein